jgi:hypothetical protein
MGRLLLVSSAILSTATLAMARDEPIGVQLALSEIKREEIPPPAGTVTAPNGPVNPDIEIPTPDPIKPAGTPASPLDDVGPVEPVEAPSNGEPDDTANPTLTNPTPADPDNADPARPNIDPNAPLPAIEYDLTKLPDAVREMHAKIRDAAKAGKLESLRALIGEKETQTQFSLGNTDEDPLAFLLSLSGDPGGQEILAILLEILDAGFVHLDVGTPQELYVWPYFFAIPLDKLNDAQRVELYKIVTSGDVEEMKSFGSYIFYRAGISPDGKWRFFLAGE